MAKFASRLAGLTGLALGHNITCNNETMAEFARTTIRLRTVVLSHHINLTDQTKQQLFARNPNLLRIRNGNQPINRPEGT